MMIAISLKKKTPDASDQRNAVFCAATLVACTALQVKGERSPYSITERGVPELIPVLGSQLLLLGEQRHDGCEQFA